MADFNLTQTGQTPATGLQTASLLTRQGGPTVRRYMQRVYDTGVAGWCYYSLPAINANPSPSDTHPPHTNNITLHQILGERLQDT